MDTYLNILILLLEHYPELPSRMGTINNVEKFDADFFGSSFEQAQKYSPKTSLLLEYCHSSNYRCGIQSKAIARKKYYRYHSDII